MGTYNADKVANAFDSEDVSLELAWSAGFVDGEGCVSIARQKMPTHKNICHRLRFSVVQSNLEVLEEIQRILGESGVIYKQKRTGQMNRQHYALKYDSRHAYNALEKLRPYLRKKHHEADAVFQMWKQGRMGQRPGAKGWPPAIYELREKWAKKISRLK